MMVWRRFSGFVLGMLFAWAVVVVIGGPVRAVGTSMLPSVIHGEVLWAWRWPLLVNRTPDRGVQRGDVVVFRSALLGEQLLKRVIGVGGDVVSISGGVIRVNGWVFPDSVVRSFWEDEGCLERDGAGDRAAVPDLGLLKESKSVRVPEGSLFVMGDNRTQGGSEDSRMFGVVATRDVQGRAAAVIWPVLRREVVVKSCGVMAARPEVPTAGLGEGEEWLVSVRRLGGLVPLAEDVDAGLVESVTETRGVIRGFLPVMKWCGTVCSVK